MADLKTTEINDTGNLTLPVGTTSGVNGRPGTPIIGMMRVNTDAEIEPIVEWYDGNQWNSLGSPPIGSTESNPAQTAAEAYEDGLRGTSIWLEIDGTAYLMDYDDTDRYSTGENGWANYTNTVFGNNYQTIPNAKYGVPSGNMTPAWNVGSSTSTTDTNIGTGQLRIGYELQHPGGNSLSTVRCAVPKHTSCYYQLTDAQSGGADTADFGTGWQTGNFGYNIYNNIAYQSNSNGYWCIMHTGDGSDTSNSTNHRILDPGNLRSGNGTWTTNNYETFGTTTTDVPYIIWGTTDAYREYAYIRDWNVWVH